jgi:nucleotide-binding universal stress UspA family protein
MFKNMLVAVDGSRHADAALDQAIDIARTQGARLTLLTAWQSFSGWAGLGAGAPITDDFTTGIEEYYRQTLDQAVARVPAELAPQAQLVEGSAGDAILGELERGSYDLVVMGSRGRGSVGSLLLGSVSHRVLHHAPVPTLIVHLAQESAPGR